MARRAFMSLAVSGAVAAITVLVVAPAARGDAPVAGGRYDVVTTRDGKRCDAETFGGCGVLAVNNDAGEFQGPSSVDFNLLDGCPVSALLSDSLAGGPAASGRITTAGTFSLHYRNGKETIRVSGSFFDRGRRVRGRASVRGGRVPKRCRGRREIRFRGTLTKVTSVPRAGRWMPCDWVLATSSRGQLLRAVRVYVRDAGCTSARAAARGVRDSTGFTAPCGLDASTNCVFAGLACTGLALGEHDPAAQVRCTQPDRSGSAIELVAATACRIDSEVVFQPWALNVQCEEALAVAAESSESCDLSSSRDRCQVLGYECRDLPPALHRDPAEPRLKPLGQRCSDPANPRRVVELFDSL